MKDDLTQKSITKRIIKYDCEVDDKELLKNFSTITAKLLYANYDKEQSLGILIDCVEDFIELFGCFSISKNIDSLLWTLIKKSLNTATEQLLHSHDIRYKKNRISKDIKEVLQNKAVAIIDFNFINNPANSTFSKFYCNRLCEWLSGFITDKTIRLIKNDWPMYFTKAFTIEWCSNKEYKKILDEFNYPTREYLEMMNKLQEYTNNILDFKKQNVFDEQIALEDIYIELKGLVKRPRKTINEVYEIRPYLFSWVTQANENMCVISGDPGSGKSTLMKMLACSLAQSGHRVVYINLFQVNFSAKKPAIDVLNEYIRKISWMKTYNLEEDVPIVLILDGLDEIKVDVWNTATELLREIKNSDWNHHKVIISGRNKIIDYCEEHVEYCLKIRVLPLYLEIQERKNTLAVSKTNSDLSFDLRQFYWSKLQSALNFEYDINLITNREHLRELSTSPLLLFLLSWTIKNTGESIDKIRHAAQIYEKILECIYTRKYNREEHDYYTWKFDEYQKILSYIGVCAWQDNSRSLPIFKIEDFCKNNNLLPLFEKWIDSHTQNNPSRLLLLFFFREKVHEEIPCESEIEFIHKSFYEYLSAVAIINLVSTLHAINDNEIAKTVISIFAKNLIGVEIMEFIEGLLESLRSDQLNTYIDNTGVLLSKMLCANWIGLASKSKENTITINDYSQLINDVRTIEQNLLILGEVISNLKKRGNIKINYGLQLHSCVFKSVNMVWKDLSYCSISKSDFSDAILSGGEFHNCNFDDLTFNKTIMNSSSFRESSFENCFFTSAHVECAHFENAKVTNSKFDSVILEGTYFTDAYLLHCKFVETNFVAANFDDAQFAEIEFVDCDFERADFNGVQIKNTSWKDCSMKSAKFDNVRIAQFNLDDPSILEMLSEADLSNAIFDDVPKHIKRKLIQ